MTVITPGRRAVVSVTSWYEAKLLSENCKADNQLKQFLCRNQLLKEFFVDTSYVSSLDSTQN